MIGFELQTWEAAALPTGSQPLLYIKDFHVNKLSTFSGLLKSAKKVSRKNCFKMSSISARRRRHLDDEPGQIWIPGLGENKPRPRKKRLLAPIL